MKRRFICLSLISLLMLFTATTLEARAAIQSTTTLAISSTTVTSGSAVTLTATVKTNTAAVTIGQVKFCDAMAASCTDIHLLGTAQLTGAGTASIKLVPSVGSHSYIAIFVGTPNGTVSTTGSTSAATALSVTGVLPSVTALVASGDPGHYTLTATVGGSGNSAPIGSISLLDASNNNAVLGASSLAGGGAGSNFLFFSQMEPAGAGNGPSLMTVGDLNGDGILDIAVVTSSTECHFNNCPDPGVTVLLGDGHENFTTGTTFDLGSAARPSSLGIADFNGDGFPDLVVADSSAQTITILEGSSTGAFTDSNTIVVGNIQSFAIADFNEDGIPDVAVANPTANLITLFLGKGDGTLTASSATPTSVNSTTIATGDFNGDGIPDLIGVNADTATILLGNGDGTFTQSAIHPAAGEEPISIAAGDFNGDGKTDVAFLDAIPATVTILLGNGDGTFAPAPNSPTLLSQNGISGGVLFVGDFNGDGKTDLATQPVDGNFLLLGDGSGTFMVAANSPVIGSPGNIEFLASGDFNGDGTTDITGPGAVLISATQTATVTIQNLAMPVATGNHQVKASYSGDTTYTGSNSGTLTLVAALGTPTVAVSSSASQVFTGTTVTLTATVAGSGLTPTGTVRFYAGSNLLGEGTLKGGGVATYTTSNLPVGSYNITASYTGDTNYNAGNSPATVVVVAAPGTGTPTMTVTPSASNVTDQQGVTVMVAVAGGTGQPTPTGVLSLTTGSYNAQQPLANGAASFAIAAGVLSSGSNTLTVTYLGDATYKSVNTTSTVTVSSIVVAVSSPASVMPGIAGTATASLSASSTYSGTMKLTCALTTSPAGAQSLPTCSLNPASVPITAGGNGTATLTMQTTAATNTALAQPSHFGLWGFGSSSVLAGLIMLGVPSRRRRWMTMLGLMLIVFAAGAIGCGGGSSSKTPPQPPGTPATTAGNYIFTVTGTDTANSTITVSTTATLTVQ
jgi:hypothetical protein